ncbi:MAG: T9SS type A sorting domain-containing protein, partial [Bacteroidota bacterium]
RVSFTKNGAKNDHWAGGNNFLEDVLVVNNGGGRLRMGVNAADSFSKHVTFEENGSGNLEPAYNHAHVFRGDVILNGGEIYLGRGNATLSFQGGQGQQLGGSSPTVWMKRMILDNSSSTGIQLLSPLRITQNISFGNGIIYNDDNTLVLIDNNALSQGANDQSYVEGPVRKIGNDAFVFPVGKNQNYRPIAISAPARRNHHFTAEYFPQSPDLASPQAYNSTFLDPTLDHISTCEYWILDRTQGNSQVSVTLFWDENSCTFPHINDLKVARWNGQQWKDQGSRNITGNLRAGTVTTAGPVSDFSPFTLGVLALGNPLPIQLLYFQAEVQGRKVQLDWETQSEINNDFFTIERSKDGQNWEIIQILKAATNGQIRNKYAHQDLDPYTGWSYYRLKQTDKDGAFTYSEIKSVKIEASAFASLKIYPNPTVDFVEIEGAEGELDYWQCFDNQGRDIKNLIQLNDQNTQKLKMDLRQLPAGTYILKTKTQVHKILKK